MVTGDDMAIESQAAMEEAPGVPGGRRWAGPVRVALIGCGAIAESMHLPILAGHEEIRLVALVDRNLERARQLAEGYAVAQVVADAAELRGGEVDAAIIATPPFHHAPCALALMERGIHVLVEKPMATC